MISDVEDQTCLRQPKSLKQFHILSECEYSFNLFSSILQCV